MTFDPKQFLNQTVSAPMATSITPAPEGEWMMMIATSIPIEEWFGVAEWKEKSSGKTMTQPTLKIPMEIIDDRAKALVKREKIVVYYDCFLDLDERGNLATGEDKNVRVGALRDALGQNADRNWTFQKLWGAGPFMGKVSHQAQKTDPDTKFAKVGRVAKIK